MKGKLLGVMLACFLTGLLLAGCAEKESGREAAYPGRVEEPVRRPAESPWRLEVDRLERRGDYDAALKVVEKNYLEHPSSELADRFTLLLSRLSEDSLDDWWRREQDETLKCRVAAEYFTRLQGRPGAAGKFLLHDLARQLVNCPVNDEVKTQARELLEREAAAAGPRITIGCLLPLSGSNARAGKYLLRGMELALGVYPEKPEPAPSPAPAAGDSAAGGDKPQAPGLPAEKAPGEKDPAAVLAYRGSGAARVRIRLLVYDTAGEGEKARAGVDYLVKEKKVSLIIGPYTGKAANYAAVEAQSLGVAMISLSPLLHDPERYDKVFLHYPTIRNQADCLARLAMLRLGLENFALLVPRNRYGREFAVDFTGRVEAWGGRVVRQVYYDAAQPDYGPAIRTLIGPERYRRYKARRREYEEWTKEKLRREAAADGAESAAEKPARLLELAREIGIADDNLKLGQDEVQPRPLLNCDFEAVVIPDRSRTLKLLLPQLAFYDLDEVFLLGGRYWNSEKLRDEVGEYADGALLVDAFSRARGVSPLLDRFLDRFRSLWPEEKPTLLDLLGYDTIGLVSRLAVKAGPDPTADNWSLALGDCRDLSLASGVTSARAGGELVKRLYPLTFSRDGIEKFSGLCQP